MATECPGTGACTDCGCLAICPSCHAESQEKHAARAREADAIVHLLVKWATPPGTMLTLNELVERARAYCDGKSPPLRSAT